MRRRGFTLIETLIALTISAVILSAIASVFVLMGRALPDESSPIARTNQLTRAIDRFSYDISWATDIVQGSAARTEFIVPEFTGTGSRDTIVYTWDGPGKAWYRSINGGTVEPLCTGVNNISMLWRYRKVAGTNTAKTLENVRVEITSTHAAAKPVITTCSAASHTRIP